MLDHFSQALTLDQIDALMFRSVTAAGRTGQTRSSMVRVQALVAAGRTVSKEHALASTQSAWQDEEHPAYAVTYKVDAQDTAGEVVRRRVTAVQRGRTLMTLHASFDRPQDGRSSAHRCSDDARSGPAGQVPPVLGDRSSHWEVVPMLTRLPVEVRTARDADWLEPIPARSGSDRLRVWLRAVVTLHDDLLHACMLSRVCDELAGSVALHRHGVASDDARVAWRNLDQTMWLLERVRFDDWLLIDLQSPWAGSSRALCRARVRDRSGRFIAEVTQEVLVHLTGRDD